MLLRDCKSSSRRSVYMPFSRQRRSQLQETPNRSPIDLAGIKHKLQDAKIQGQRKRCVVSTCGKACTKARQHVELLEEGKSADCSPGLTKGYFDEGPQMFAISCIICGHDIYVSCGRDSVLIKNANRHSKSKDLMEITGSAFQKTFFIWRVLWLEKSC